MKLDIEVRWNSTYDMILRAMRLRVPLKSWLESQMVDDPALDRLTLTNIDWKKLKYLIVLLRPFAEFTSLLGSTKDTTINHTWNVYNHLFNHLETLDEKLKRKDVALNPWIPEFILAIQAGLDKLKGYYSKTDGPIENQYALAAMLDPSQKLDIFNSTDWGPAYKVKYKKMFLRQWEDHYKDSSVEDDNLDIDLTTSYPTRSLNSIFRLNRQTSGVRTATSGVPKSEAERYLTSTITSDGPEKSVLNIWEGLESSYPSVAKMARDVLAVPG